MSEWTDADAEAVAAEIHVGYGCGPEVTPDGPGENCPPDWEDRKAARALLASGVVVPARVVEEAAASAEIADTRARYDRDCADMAAQELSRLRSAVEALADEWERLAAGNEAARGKATRVAAYYRRCAHMLRALLTEGRDRAGEGAGT